MFDFAIYLYKLLILQPAYSVYILGAITLSLILSYLITACLWSTTRSHLRLRIVFIVSFCILMSGYFNLRNPKDIYNQIKEKQEFEVLIAKTCKLKALGAQPGQGVFSVDKDEWVCPDNKSFYLPEKYRPENWITELAMMKEG